jgi:hypothetical protein
VDALEQRMDELEKKLNGEFSGKCANYDEVAKMMDAKVHTDLAQTTTLAQRTRQ